MALLGTWAATCTSSPSGITLSFEEDKMRAQASYALALLCLQPGIDAFTPSTKLVQVRPRTTTKLDATAALEWNDNAKWLEQCQQKQVVSWYDTGLRLKKPEGSTSSSADAAPTDSLDAVMAGGGASGGASTKIDVRAGKNVDQLADNGAALVGVAIFAAVLAGNGAVDKVAFRTPPKRDTGLQRAIDSGKVGIKLKSGTAAQGQSKERFQALQKMTAEERAQFLTKEKQQNAETARLAKEQRIADAAKLKEEKQLLFQARKEADDKIKADAIQAKAEAKAARKAARGVGFEAAKKK